MKRLSATLLALALAGSGCSQTQARAAYVRDQMKALTFPSSCEALWAEGLKLLAQQGFELVGRDRAVAGQAEQSGLATFMSAGSATSLDAGGVLEASTDWNGQRFRYRIRGTPEGPNGCRIQITGIQQDRTSMDLSEWRDHDMELLLLARVAPPEAARIEDGADRAAR